MDNPFQMLINLVLDNIIVVFVIVGAIWSLLGRMFKGSGQPNKPPGRMPDFGGGGIPDRPQRQGNLPRVQRHQHGDSPEHAPMYPPVVMSGQDGPMGRPAHQHPTEPQFEGSSGGEGRSSEWRGESAEGRQSPFGQLEPSPTVRAKIPLRRSILHDKAPDFPSVLPDPDDIAANAAPVRLTTEDMRQAVLWAEILGPPRSRKPNRR
ncbi:hypothetical protein [Paenibacillus herberti]|uniref:Uncharacterized protein n=1 Tax=Paenibacillus herberti TaxID=1619309 RepID=A0A229P048_9BACL|nr:hypothetical protein [Paenibacillus herberti]OXM15612.1 hypothetical protein CGZ75_02445 [Paenibacillus herberti]